MIGFYATTNANKNVQEVVKQKFNVFEIPPTF